MTENNMVFFAEIAFIYGGNDSSEKDVFGSEKSSEKIIKSSERSSETTAISSGTGSGTHLTSSWTSQAAKTSMGTSIHRNQAKNILKFDISVIFARKPHNSNLKHN